MSRIMVTEDSASIRLLLRRRLEMAGHEVIEARDGDDAIQRLESLEPDAYPDLMLLDAMMPRRSGAEVLKLVKAHLPETPVLVVSAVSDLDLSDEWSEADGYLDKPIDFGELLARISLLTGGQPRPGSRSP
jgi:DNA-binding response OmpR family regulator